MIYEPEVCLCLACSFSSPLTLISFTASTQVHLVTMLLPQEESGERRTSTESGGAEKRSAEIEEVEVVPTKVGDVDSDRTAELPPMKLTPAEEKKLYRKIDWRLLPILTVIQLCSYLDRGMLLLRYPASGTFEFNGILI